jgi:peptidoglycan/LPS O-acetylase OafA/YrhL
VGVQSPLVTEPGPNTRIASLDGLRAVSVAFVILGHLVGTQSFPRELYPLGRFAEFGVRIFFVISGFLITTLLLKEIELTGSISLRQFYFRRIFRIFPASYAYIAAIGALAFAHALYLRSADLLHAVTYTVNYHSVRGWYLGHLWSLSVEEQFYLLWPLALKLSGRRRGIIVALTVCVACPLIRMAEFALLPAARLGVGERFETVADAIATGCILAGARDWLSSQKWYIGLLSSKWFFLIPILTLSLNLPMRVRYEFGVAETLKNVGIALCIDWCIRFRSHPAGRFLSWSPVAFLGVLSYSLYLWQQPFLDRYGSSTLTHFPLNCLLALGAALASYYLVERPFLRVKKHFESSRVKSAAATDLRAAIDLDAAPSSLHSDS